MTSAEASVSQSKFRSADLLDDLVQIWACIQDLSFATSRQSWQPQGGSLRESECLRELRFLKPRPKETSRSRLQRPGSNMLHLIPLGKEFREGGSYGVGKQGQGPQKWFPGLHCAGPQAHETSRHSKLRSRTTQPVRRTGHPQCTQREDCIGHVKSAEA